MSLAVTSRGNWIIVVCLFVFYWIHKVIIGIFLLLRKKGDLVSSQ